MKEEGEEKRNKERKKKGKKKVEQHGEEYVMQHCQSRGETWEYDGDGTCKSMDQGE
jgi:hypothetical protein